MTKTTIDRIRNAAYNRSTVVIGKYTYKADLNTGAILRCKTADVGREWIDNEGRRSSAWVVVAHL